MNTLVFVYGSLKKGFGNHRLLEKAISHGKGTISGRIYSLGSYPGLKEAVDDKVHGELYEVNDATLAALDRLEGHPRMYERKEVAVYLPGDPEQMDDDATVAWTYFYNGSVDNRHYIRSGEW